MGMKWGVKLISVTMAVALAMASAVCGQTNETDEPVFEPGPGITPPKVIHQVSPKPDSGSKGFRISGTVLVGLIVSSHGMPVNVHVIRSIDEGIDKSVVQAVQEWRFEPARKDGKPVALRLTVEIRFNDL